MTLNDVLFGLAFLGVGFTCYNLGDDRFPSDESENTVSLRIALSLYLP
jgi:hypothetical protein